MKLKILRLKGIRSYSQEAIVTFDEGRTLIKGMNGAGKSTIFYAIKFALFGYFIHRGFGDKDYFRLRDKEMRVELEFEHEGVDYRVTRWITKGGTHNVLLESNEFEPIAAIKAAQDKMMDILGIDQNLVDETLLIRQGEFTKILNQTPTELKKTFEGFFQIEQYRTFKKGLNTIVRDITKNNQSISDQIDKNEEIIKEYPAKLHQFKQNKLNRKSKKTALETLEEKQRKLEKEREELSKLENELLDKKNALSGEKTALEELEGDLEELAEDMKQYPEFDQMDKQQIKLAHDFFI